MGKQRWFVIAATLPFAYMNDSGPYRKIEAARKVLARRAENNLYTRRFCRSDFEAKGQPLPVWFVSDGWYYDENGGRFPYYLDGSDVLTWKNIRMEILELVRPPEFREIRWK